MKKKKKIGEFTRVTMFGFLGLFVIACLGIADSYSEIIPPDRRIQWSPGIASGIPTRSTICANVKNAPYNAKGDDSANDAAAIQDAINDCAEGQVVYLPEGTYRINGELNIEKGIVLRGDGPDKTKIKSYATSGDMISITTWDSPTSTGIVSGYTKGSTSLTVGSSSSFNVGDYIIVTQDNDPALVDPAGCNWCGNNNNGGQAMAQIVKITAKNGDSLTINRPLYFTFSASLSPEIVILTPNPIVNVGIEDLYIERVNSGQWGNNIYMDGCVNCWVKNIESYNCLEAHMRIKNSYACVIRDSFFHHGHSFDGGGAYGVFLFGRNSDHLVENNIFYYLRHSMVMEGGGSGNVFGYNYSDRMFDNTYPDTDWLMSDLSTHGAHPYMNLFEGNIGSHLSFDFVWGTSSHNTAFRNWLDRTSEGEAQEINLHHFSVDIQSKNLYHNVVGNVLGVSGDSGDPWRLGCESDGDCESPDPNVANTLLRHGNHDYGSQSTQWDPGISDHNLPNSLYLSSKPSFFGDKQWPPFGPDLNPVVRTIPAKERFESPSSADSTIPSPPKNLRKVSN